MEKQVECHFGPCCDFLYAAQEIWRTEQEDLPSYSAEPVSSGPNDVADVIDYTVDSYNASLRDLSLKIHGTNYKGKFIFDTIHIF